MESLTSWLNWRSPEQSKFAKKTDLKFFIHDEEHAVQSENISPDTTLITYLRDNINLTGTKLMCLEGGCGSCVVTASLKDIITGKEIIISVNACLIPLYKVYGWKIFVIDQIGNFQKSYHPLQKAIVKYNGTQCGYCTSGMIMNMYSIYSRPQTFTMQEVENAFGGNICRCTGYRSILAAFKSFASDSPHNANICDIEDVRICKKDKESCASSCKMNLKLENQAHFFENLDVQWYRAFSVEEVLDIVEKAVKAEKVYMLVGGNTATGVYRRPANIQIFVDIGNVKPLIGHTVGSDTVILGANKTLTATSTLFSEIATTNEQFYHLQKVVDHISLVATLEVRNIGTLAGNLMTKHGHHEFPSDVFLLLETLGATLTLVGIDRREYTKNLIDFLTWDMNGVIIKHITIRTFGDNFYLDSYKMMPVAQNSVANLNAGFAFQLNDENIVQDARIVYGGINPNFIHATSLENYLVNKNLFTNETLQGSLRTLDEELDPNYVITDPPPKYRKGVALGLFYKFILSIAPDNLVSPYYKSGSVDLHLIRGVSSGTQSYGSVKSEYPLTAPVPKLEAFAQTSGKAEYIIDIPDEPHQLFAAFVLAKAPANSTIINTDPSKALALIGVIDYVDKRDIPGVNNFMPQAAIITNTFIEEVFCSGTVKYYNQPIGLIVATNKKLAEDGAKLVEITYKKADKKPLLTIREILANNATDKIFPEAKIKATRRGTDIKHVIKGTFDYSWQYHYHMETQCCMAVPIEDGINLYPSTQDINLAQTAAAKVLNIPINKVNVEVRRVGGAYGGKISRNSQISCATAVAAYKLQKPMKLHMTFEDNMNAIGKRYPCSADYEIGVDDRGVIQYLESSYYTDYGASGGNENITKIITKYLTNQYNFETWNISLFSTRSDNHTSTWCRAPGSFDAEAFLENIMQHIATEINQDPTQVRLLNTSYKEVHNYVKELTDWADVDSRIKAVNDFNKNNRWVKKGICVVPMRFNIDPHGPWNARVSIFEGDGTVAVSHGGIEIGQGINTKAAQVCAFALGISLDQVSIKPTFTTFTSNNYYTGYSTTSESVANAIQKACEILNKRIQPVRDRMPKDSSWRDIIKECFHQEIDLSASFMHNEALPYLHSYKIYGATCAEVTVDTLTGFFLIDRVDILEDMGDSLNPLIDVGQVEGGFIMGLSFWTCEKLIFDDDGQLLTNRTWTFKVCGAKDIPIEFNVKLPKNNPNKLGILRCKGAGEPPICMAIVIPLAIRNAIASARKNASPEATAWYPIDGPSSVVNNYLESLNDYKQYALS